MGFRLSNMNSTLHGISYELLKVKYGEFCMMCLASHTERELVIDHIDNDNSNNNPNNLQFLCRSCNYKKNPRFAEREPLDLCEGVRGSDSGTIPTEITINRVKEPAFREYVDDIMRNNDEMLASNLIDSGAEKVGISVTTASRYLKKLCSSEGKFEKIRKGIQYYIIHRTI